MFLFSKSLATLKINFNLDETHVCVCPLQAIPWKHIEVVIIKLGTVTASDMRIHHGLSILTMTFIQGHTDLNHEKNIICFIISETVQVTPIQFTVKIVQLKVYI